MQCKTFAATTPRDREQLGDRVTDWLRAREIEVLDKIVNQSSDATHHCLSLVLFYEPRDQQPRRTRSRR